MAKLNKLTDKQEIFVREFLVDLNAKQAYIRAGFDCKYPERAAYQMMQNESVREAIREHLQQKLNSIDITADRVLSELATVAFSNIKDLAKWDDESAQVFDSEKISDQAARSIAEITTTRNKLGVKIKIKLHNKNQALEVLCKYLGLLDKDGRLNNGSSDSETDPLVDALETSAEADWSDDQGDD